MDGEGKGMQTPASIDTAEVEDDGLGGCKLAPNDLPGNIADMIMQMASSMRGCCCRH